MKKYLIIIILVFFVSCKNETKTPVTNAMVSKPSIETGQALFQNNNCAACHYPNQKVVGPSLQEIANIYKSKNGSMVAFLQEKAQPIVDPAMYESMKINLEITKNLSESELKSLEIYILSFLK